MLFGLVLTKLHHADDDAAELVLAVEWHRYWDMLVMMLPIHARDGTTESVLDVACQGTTADHQGAVIDRHGAPPIANIPTPAIRVPSSTVKVPPPTAKVPSPTVKAPQSTVRVSPPSAKVPSPTIKMPLILQCQGRNWLLLWDVFIVEAINLTIWIFTPAPRWAPTVMVYDNNLE
jgi:cell division septation protein DedD